MEFLISLLPLGFFGVCMAAFCSAIQADDEYRKNCLNEEAEYCSFGLNEKDEDL